MTESFTLVYLKVRDGIEKKEGNKKGGGIKEVLVLSSHYFSPLQRKKNIEKKLQIKTYEGLTKWSGLAINFYSNPSFTTLAKWIKVTRTSSRLLPRIAA